jgi:prevent-host-death family protein
MTPATPATSDEAVPHERLLVDVYTSVYTSTVPKTVAVRELRMELARWLDEVVDRREHVVVTRRGQPAAVLIPIDGYDALEETAEILSDAETRHAVDAGLAELDERQTVSLDDVRRELAARRRSR